MENRWREIWSRRKIQFDKLGGITDEFTLYKELKRIDGFDVQVEDEEAYYREFYNSIKFIFKSEIQNDSISDIYEVGCGSGANLLLFRNAGLKVGGIDYSEQLIKAAQIVLPDSDIQYGDAENILVNQQYDVVISDSVFAYFPSSDYGMNILEKMFQKAKKKVVLLEIFDKALEEECVAFRRASVDNYDEIYQGLDKVFYSRDAFTNFAHRHNCTIDFFDVTNKYYWNSKYMYHCIITK